MLDVLIWMGIVFLGLVVVLTLVGLVLVAILVAQVVKEGTHEDRGDSLERMNGKLPYDYFEAKRTGGKNRVGRKN